MAWRARGIPVRVGAAKSADAMRGIRGGAIHGAGGLSKSCPELVWRRFVAGVSRPCVAPDGMRARCMQVGRNPRAEWPVVPAPLSWFAFSDSGQTHRRRRRPATRSTLGRPSIGSGLWGASIVGANGPPSQGGRRVGCDADRGVQFAAGSARNDLPNEGLRACSPVVSTTSAQALRRRVYVRWNR